METKNATTEQRLPEHVEAPALYAGFWMRAAAWVIDSLLLSPLAVLLICQSPEYRRDTDPDMFLIIELMIITIIWLYFVLFESSPGQATLGKRALGLVVTNEYGQRIGFGRATARFFGKFLSRLIFYVGYMLAGWTARKQALHDMLASTYVVRKEGLRKFESGELREIQDMTTAGMPRWAIALVILVVIAPAVLEYKNYLIRAQVDEGVALAQNAKDAVTRYVINHAGARPEDNAAVGLPAPTSIANKYVLAIEVSHGDVVAAYGKQADARIARGRLLWHPVGVHDMQWACFSKHIPIGYLPVECRPVE